MIHNFKLQISGFFFSYFASVGIYVIFLPKMLQSIGYSSIQIGFIFAIIPLMRFLTPFFFLKIFSLDQKIYYLSLLSSLLSILLFYLTIENFYLFCANMVIFGISTGLILPYIETLALEKLKKEKYGKSRLWGSIGFMLMGLVLAKVLKDHFMGLHFYVLSIFLTVIFGYAATFNANSYKKQKPKEKNDFSLISHWHFWLSIFLMQMSFGFFYSFFTIYETDHGFTLETVSYLWAFSIVCEIIMFRFQSRIIKFDLMLLIKFATFITVIRWLLLYLYPDSLTISYFSQSFHAVSFALYHTATIAYLYEIYTRKRLAQQFYYGISFGLGGFIGSLIAGYFYGEYLFLIASFITLISFITLFGNKK